MSQDQARDPRRQQPPFVMNGQLHVVDRHAFGLIVRMDVTGESIRVEFEISFHDVHFCEKPFGSCWS